MVCPYCSADNEDGETFCTECGRPLKKQEIKKKEAVRKGYRTEGDAVYHLSGCSITAEEGLEDVVCFPDEQRPSGEKYELVFYGRQGVFLSDYLKQKLGAHTEQKLGVHTEQSSGTHLNRESGAGETLIRSLGERILYILNRIQKRNLLAGSCDMDDFFLVDGDPGKMILRAVRPLISLRKPCIPPGYECGELAAPEIRNGDPGRIRKSTDVYLAALVLNRVLIGGRYIPGDIESQIFWAYVCTTPALGKDYCGYHHWLGRCLSMLPERRERDMEACLGAFEGCRGTDAGQNQDAGQDQDAHPEQDVPGLNIRDAMETNVGTGKKAMMRSLGRDKAEWNEDVIEKWEDAGKGVTAYLLADGISNCDIGSGYRASNIIRENFIRVLEENVREGHEDITRDLAERTAYRIVELSNSAIWEEALKEQKAAGRVMGSTFIFLMAYEGEMYYYSLGDSLLYLIRNGSMIPLNSPDNAGFQALKSGTGYDEYKSMDGRDSITIYVGGGYARAQSRYYAGRRIEAIALKAGDIVMASSDGVIDYYGTRISDTRWEKEDALARRLTDRKKSLEERAQAVIRRDNRNGGGDNLSVILIEVYGGDGNERI